MASLEFPFRTGKVVIDYTKCKTCDNYACVKACSLFGGNLFRIENGKPVLISSPAESGRRCIEDLSCELYCQAWGNKGLTITLDSMGADEYRQKINMQL